jgi:hypothetical protein
MEEPYMRYVLLWRGLIRGNRMVFHGAALYEVWSFMEGPYKRDVLLWRGLIRGMFFYGGAL